MSRIQPPAITETQVYLNPQHQGYDNQLLGYCSIEIAKVLVIHGLKIISGKDAMVVGMPDRTMKNDCPHCERKNVFNARYCNWCGGFLPEDRSVCNGYGRQELYLNIAYPVNPDFRQYVQRTVLDAYSRACRKGAAT